MFVCCYFASFPDIICLFSFDTAKRATERVSMNTMKYNWLTSTTSLMRVMINVFKPQLTFQSVYNMLDAVGAKPKDDPCARAGIKHCSFGLTSRKTKPSQTVGLHYFFVQMKSSRGLTWTMMGS